MENISLKNKEILVNILKMGAEVQSIVLLPQNSPVLWQKDNLFWKSKCFYTDIYKLENLGDIKGYEGGTLEVADKFGWFRGIMIVIKIWLNVASVISVFEMYSQNIKMQKLMVE